MDTVTITVKLPGQPAETLEGLTSFVLVAIPEKNPQNDTKLLSAGLVPKAMAECGAYIISCAKHMMSGTLRNIAPLGNLTAAEQKVIKPTAQGRTPSGLHLP